jgi:6-phosphogluconolactonase
VTAPDVTRAADSASLAAAAADALVDRLRSLVAERGRASLVLTGGGIGTATLRALADRAEEVDWDRLELWWGDERYLPDGDAERNETGAREALLDRVPLDPARVHAVPGPDRSGSVEEAAAAYAAELTRVLGPDPVLDVVLLGVGPDAHVASLFPGHPALRDDRLVVPVHGSPKPPPLRVSLSMPTITSAREVWLLAAGPEKAAAVALATAPGTSAEQAPAAAARGRERTRWFLDDAAAGQAPGG